MKALLNFTHFSPTEPKTEKVWAFLNYNDRIYAGWVPNFLGVTELYELKEISKECEIISSYFIEHRNGGRTNNKRYNSIAEYRNDPYVKECYFNYLTFSPWVYEGNPESVDEILTVKVDDVEFTLSCIIYDVIPESWYSDYVNILMPNLDNYEIYKSAEEAIKSIKIREDLFGDRIFPVIKVPSISFYEIRSIIEGNFKSRSKPIMKDGFVYFGIRGKVNQIDAIEEIYSNNGFVVKNLEWEW